MANQKLLFSFLLTAKLLRLLFITILLFEYIHAFYLAHAMESEGTTVVYKGGAITYVENNFAIKVRLAQLLQGETNSKRDKITESAGAFCVIVSDPVGGGFSRMPDPKLIKEIKESVSVRIMAKVRVGHFVEGQILREVAGVEFIDESETIAVADEDHFINKHNFRLPFVCGCRNLGETLSRVIEGASMIRAQGDLSASGNIAETVRNVRKVMGDIRRLSNMDYDEVFEFSKKIGAPYDIIVQVNHNSRLPVVHFAAEGIVTPADAALMMKLGCDGVFVGFEIFNCLNPYKRICAFVDEIKHYDDPSVLAEVSSKLQAAMADLRWYMVVFGYAKKRETMKLVDLENACSVFDEFTKRTSKCIYSITASSISTLDILPDAVSSGSAGNNMVPRCVSSQMQKEAESYLVEELGFTHVVLIDKIENTDSGVHFYDTNSTTRVVQSAKPLVDFPGSNKEKVIVSVYDPGGVCISSVVKLFLLKVSKAIFIVAKCNDLFDEYGKLLGSASSSIQIWKEGESSTDIWHAICGATKAAFSLANVSGKEVKGLSFAAICSLVVVHSGGFVITVSWKGDTRRNVIVWMGHRAVKQVERINASNSPALQYCGGSLSQECSRQSSY